MSQQVISARVGVMNLLAAQLRAECIEALNAPRRRSGMRFVMEALEQRYHFHTGAPDIVPDLIYPVPAVIVIPDPDPAPAPTPMPVPEGFDGSFGNAGIASY